MVSTAVLSQACRPERAIDSANTGCLFTQSSSKRAPTELQLLHAGTITQRGKQRRLPPTMLARRALPCVQTSHSLRRQSFDAATMQG